VNRAAAETADVPLEVVTVTSTVPAAWGGTTAVRSVVELTMNAVAGVVPKRTSVTPAKFVPEMVRTVPPAVEPDVVPIAVTVGAPK
jgi:hypothetical protein